MQADFVPDLAHVSFVCGPWKHYLRLCSTSLHVPLTCYGLLLLAARSLSHLRFYNWRKTTVCGPSSPSWTTVSALTMTLRKVLLSTSEVEKSNLPPLGQWMYHDAMRVNIPQRGLQKNCIDIKVHKLINFTDIKEA